MRILILGGQGKSTRILVNRILASHPDAIVTTIIESPVPRTSLIRSRFKRLGIVTTLGQLAFMTLALPILRAISRRRITEIMSQYSLDESELPSDTTRYVTNVNSSDTVRYIKEFAPDVVLVNGTRIIRSHVLECTDAPFINPHAGVTPMYRGVHGGYWALWNQDHRQFGATVHLVDKGVDTGTPISFATTVPDRRDNFCTYPLLQQAISLPGIQLALEDLAAGKMLRRADSPARFSRQWYHPTLWGYASGLLRGVK